MTGVFDGGGRRRREGKGGRRKGRSRPRRRPRLRRLCGPKRLKYFGGDGTTPTSACHSLGTAQPSGSGRAVARLTFGGIWQREHCKLGDTGTFFFSGNRWVSVKKGKAGVAWRLQLHLIGTLAQAGTCLCPPRSPIMSCTCMGTHRLIEIDSRQTVMRQEKNLFGGRTMYMTWERAWYQLQIN